MAKALRKLTDFFNGYKKECRLIDYRALVSKGDEKRIKLTAEIQLSGGLKATKHLDDRFVPLFGVMEKEDSTTNLVKEAVSCEDMTIDLFLTDSGPKSKTITGCSLQDFRLVATGEKDKRKVCLEFIIYMPADKPLNEWAFGHLHKTFWIEAVPSQAELPLSASTTKSTALTVVPPDKKANGANGKEAKPAGKSGPKDLDKFHQTQAAKEDKAKPQPVQ